MSHSLIALVAAPERATHVLLLPELAPALSGDLHVVEPDDAAGVGAAHQTVQVVPRDVPPRGAEPAAPRLIQGGALQA